MKVSELKKGMLIKCANPNQTIRTSGFAYNENDVPWANVVPKKRPNWLTKQYTLSDKESDVVMYIGTKKDVNVNAAWSDKFVLMNGKIVAIDPSAWRKLMPVTE